MSITTAPRIPRDKDDDYTPDITAERREFLREQTGASLDHVGQFSFDPGVLPGNVENFSGVAQVPIGVAGPLQHQRRARPRGLLRAAGDHRGHARRELQPRDARC